MSYISPIKIGEIRQMEEGWAEKMGKYIAGEVDNLVLESCVKVGCHVDKDELEKALRYDRDQYVKGYEDGKRDAAAAIEELQAELNSRTIYGYSVDKLIMFAEMCKRNDVQEHDLKQAAWNLELAVRAVMNERQEIIKNAVGEITMRCTPDFEKAFKEMRDRAKMEVQE